MLNELSFSSGKFGFIRAVKDMGKVLLLDCFFMCVLASFRDQLPGLGP